MIWVLFHSLPSNKKYLTANQFSWCNIIIFSQMKFLLTSCKIFFLGDRAVVGANCQRLNFDIFVQTLLLEVYATMLIILKVTFSYITDPFVCKWYSCQVSPWKILELREMFGVRFLVRNWGFEKFGLFSSWPELSSNFGDKLKFGIVLVRTWHNRN